jgi:hypothetical protein
MADQFSRLYDVERVGGDQRTRLAELLRSQGMNTPQGQMVSGWYVPPSWSQNLNSALQMGLGTYMGMQLDEERKAKTAEILRQLSQGKEVEPIPAVQNFNGMERMGEGQTPMPQQAPQNELERLTRKAPVSAEQSQMTPAMAPRQEQRFVPLSEEEKIGKVMELAQYNPYAAQIWSAQDTARQNRLSEEERRAADREFKRESQLLGFQQQENLARLHGAIAAAGRTPASEKPLTEYQGQSVLYGTRAAQSNKILDNVASDPAAVEASRRGGMIGNWFSPSNVQQTVQAQRDFINAVLRRESGATISPAEFENANKQYFPQPGDKPEVLAQKKANRDLVIKGFATQAGPAGKGHVMEVYNAPYVSLDNQQQAAPQKQGRLGGTTPPSAQGGEWSIRPKQ